MQLIGMLDSPYVRRVAISLQLLGLPFTHRSLSVFRTFPEFQAINPVVKAPTLVCDDGEVLMDSSLILQYAEALAHPRTLLPTRPQALQRALRLIGLALAACEKSVQIIYECALRPPEKRHEPWVSRVTGQLLAACGALEHELQRRPLAADDEHIDQAGITVAVAWHFIQQMLAEMVPAAQYPALVAFSARAEQGAAFRAAPHGDGTVPQREVAMKVTTFLMFAGAAEEAMTLYASVIPQSRIESLVRYGRGEAGKEGRVKRAVLDLAGTRYMCFDSPVQHAFTFTPATSLFVEVDSREQFDAIFTLLGEGGQVLMPPDNYGFSSWFGWLQDRFGVSWQLNVA
jgi:predicted 3-demethylubiquinone-9 3-methyltransferase (glyoxalase superfamily)/glutathione S-transferase